MKKLFIAMGIIVSSLTFVSLVSAQTINASGCYVNSSGIQICASTGNGGGGFGGGAFSGTVGGVNTNVGGSLFNLLAVAQGLVNRLVPFMIGLATIAFFWYLIKYVYHYGTNRRMSVMILGREAIAA